jgi:hypothetical protein
VGFLERAYLGGGDGRSDSREKSRATDAQGREADSREREKSTNKFLSPLYTF